jgi:ring-1,2-phenylacetyl-CoA epoxidase subunit PaaA
MGYDSGELNWEEFYNIVRGNGPCNKQRIHARKKAYDEGAWVREAALAHANKMKSRKDAVEAIV